MKAIEPLLGVYAFDNTQRTFFSRGGRLYTQRAGGGELEVFPAGNDRFFYAPDDLTWFEVVRDAAGKPRIAFHSQGNATAVMSTRTGPPPADKPAIAVPAATLDSYAGSYTSMVGIFIIKHEGEGLTVKLGEQQTLPMKAVSGTEFEITQVGAKIRFNVKDGKAGSITLFQGGQEIEGLRKD